MLRIGESAAVHLSGFSCGPLTSNCRWKYVGNYIYWSPVQLELIVSSMSEREPHGYDSLTYVVGCWLVVCKV